MACEGISPKRGNLLKPINFQKALYGSPAIEEETICTNQVHMHVSLSSYMPIGNIPCVRIITISNQMIAHCYLYQCCGIIHIELGEHILPVRINGGDIQK